MIADYLILVLSFWSSLSIRSNSFFILSSETFMLVLISPLISVPIFYFFGLYNSMTRYTSYQSIRVIILGVSIYTTLWFMLLLYIGIFEKPYDFLIINWILTIFLIGGVRIVIRWLLTAEESSSTKIVIYGAGSAGIQLKSAIEYNPSIKVSGFLDDDPNIQGLDIENIRVYKPSLLPKLIDKKDISQVLIALPTITRSEKVALLQSLKKYPVEIRSLPDLGDIVEGKILVSDLKKIKIGDLLGRAPCKPDIKLLSKDINNKAILVTGAGGSIGSQLAREIITNQPSKLVLLDISEFSLYKIENELIGNNTEVEVVPIIGNVVDQKFLSKVIKRFNIKTVYHAAAYKHVPMVEKNIVSAIKVNIFGTLSAINASIQSSVDSFVFISTDKAVRPTNIMGATKRFAELILQAISNSEANNKGNLRISVVRFGNVLGSSGSVVPLFEQQIKNGGPVTVTDPKIIRYFMTIKEASQLVIQSGAMGKNGDIFVLDMGEQIKIIHLAEDMIRLSGMTVKNQENPDGDIEIIYTGLRPGEKLYEELFIGNKVSRTDHDQIMRTDESFVNWSDLEKDLANLTKAIESYDFDLIISIMGKRIDGFNHDKKITDNLFFH
jgi:FlaA1/EpsC-like NDP-sugar epimerase